jgi:hypothetical protein
MDFITTNARDHRARRAAKRYGCIAKKGRAFRHTIHNRGGFQIVDPETNFVVDGSYYELSADDVLTWAADQERFALDWE